LIYDFEASKECPLGVSPNWYQITTLVIFVESRVNVEVDVSHAKAEEHTKARARRDSKTMSERNSCLETYKEQVLKLHEARSAQKRRRRNIWRKNVTFSIS
jgi:hypothetical protein